jgi:hypothetical protein
MPMALQTQRNGKVEISKANAWRMVPNATTSRRPQQTIRHAYMSTLENLGFQKEKGQLKVMDDRC